MAQGPQTTARTPWDAAWHLRAELGRILDQLARYLDRQRERGRTTAGDAVRGLVIEDGEAEGLIASLAGDLSGTAPSNTAAPVGDDAAEIAERVRLGTAQGAFLPLSHVQRAFELRAEEYDALLLALAVEIDPRFGRIVAYLNDHVSRTRPTLGLALALASLELPTPLSPVGFLDRPVVRDGLIEIDGDAPLPGLSLKLPQALITRLTGVAREIDEPWLTVEAVDSGLLARLVLDEQAARRLTVWSNELRANRSAPPLIIAGAAGNGRSTAARAAFFAAGYSMVQVDVAPDNALDRLRIARREARWHDAALVVRAAESSTPPWDWGVLWRALDSTRPIALVLQDDHASAAAAAAPVEPALISLEEPGVALRTRLWPLLLPRGDSIPETEVAELAARFPFGPGRIARAVRRAVGDLTLRPPGERRLDSASLLAAARVVDSATIGPLAQKMALPYTRHDLIVPPKVEAELDLALAWVRHRHRVLHEWGFVGRVSMGHGLTALFSGPSGTGKTMAAQVLARELGLELYRVDFSQLMSKFIGETEKNISLVYSARVGVLFFDEAEVILGRRHETKDARDRYANVEIAYLLQRMEEYDGVTVLATNRMQDIDEAFIRRIHVVADFPMPSEADRKRIWEGMLPSAAERDPDLDLGALAREFDISGGQIKNAALAAAYLAAAANRPIHMDHLRRAATRELVKSGKVIDTSG
jgi:hypothetical protein